MTNRIRFTSAAQVLAAFPSATADLGPIPDGIAPLDHLAALAARREPGAALLFAALMLPKRESVWWGCLTLRAITPADPMVAEGLKVAEAWVRRPEEDERRAAGLLAQSHNFEGPGAWIAFAAFTSGGSLAPAGLQAVPPPADTCGRSVYCALMQAAIDENPLLRIARIRAAAASAAEFGAGGDGTGPWKAPLRVPTPEAWLAEAGRES